MAYIWYRDIEDVWTASPLDGRAMDLTVCPPRAIDSARSSDEAGRATLIRAQGSGGADWVLLAGETVRVNGLPPLAGVRVLQDRDEIVVGAGAAMFFSVETLARIEDFPGAPQPVYCGRCRQAMSKGQPAVRCPQCGLYYHQTADLPCWTYAETCGFCPQKTALDAGLTWVPEA